MKRLPAAVLCLLLSACHMHGDDHVAKPTQRPSETSVVLGPVRLPLPPGWANLGSSCPNRQVMLVGPPDLACPESGHVGGAIWGGESKGPSGQSTVGTVAGHRVHLGRYGEERSSEIVVSFDDAEYTVVIYVALDHSIRRSDRVQLEHLLSSLTDA
jgi:hypothetical protein